MCSKKNWVLGRKKYIFHKHIFFSQSIKKVFEYDYSICFYCGDKIIRSFYPLKFKLIWGIFFFNLITYNVYLVF